MKRETSDHKALVLLAGICAEHVLPIFEAQYPDDKRPLKAIEAGRAWVHDEISVSEVRAAALAAHATGHAVHAAAHAVKAARYGAHPNEADRVAAEEREWQVGQPPAHLRSVAFP